MKHVVRHNDGTYPAPSHNIITNRSLKCNVQKLCLVGNVKSVNKVSLIKTFVT